MLILILAFCYLLMTLVVLAAELIYMFSLPVNLDLAGIKGGHQSILSTAEWDTATRQLIDLSRIVEAAIDRPAN
jgi:hypothetical protein